MAKGLSGQLFSINPGNNKITINPNDDVLTLTAAGLTSDNEYDYSELFGLDDTIDDLYAGRADYSGSPGDFPLVYVTGSTVFTQNAIDEMVKYRDHDPVISYKGVTTLIEADLPDLPGDNTKVYYDAPYNIYDNKTKLRLELTDRWTFDKGGSDRIENFDLDYTETRTVTPRVASTVSVEINYQIAGEPPSELIEPRTLQSAQNFFPVSDSCGTYLYDVKTKQKSTITGSVEYSFPDHPTWNYGGSPVGGFGQTDYRGSRSVVAGSSSSGVYLNGTENIMRPGQSFAVSFWFPPDASGFRPVLCKHGEDGANTGFSHWFEIDIEDQSVFCYFGGSQIVTSGYSQTRNGHFAISCENVSGNQFNVTIWKDGVKTVDAQSHTFANMRDVNRTCAFLARTDSDAISAPLESANIDKPISNLTLYNTTISDQTALFLYHNPEGAILAGLSGDSNANDALVRPEGYANQCFNKIKTNGYPVRFYTVSFAGKTSYEFGPSALIKAPWLAGYSQTRPNIDPSITSDKLVDTIGVDILCPAESSNWSFLWGYDYQEFDTGNSSPGEFMYNAAQYKIQADNAGIKFYPIGPFFVDTDNGVRRGVGKASQLQYDAFVSLKAEYPKTVDPFTGYTDPANNYRPYPQYAEDAQHPSQQFEKEFGEGQMFDRFGGAGLKLLEDRYPDLSTFCPVIIPDNYKDGDYIEFVDGDQITFEFYAFNGDIHGNEAKTQIETLTQGINNITLSFTDGFGNTGTQDISVEYGPSLDAVIGEWPLDAIVSDVLDDTTIYENDFTITGNNKETVTINGGKLDLPASGGYAVKAPEGTGVWLPYNAQFGFMGWFTFDDVTNYGTLIGCGGTAARRAIIIESGLIKIAQGANNAASTAIGTTTFSTGVEYHIAVQLREDAGATSNIGKVYDLYINGALDSTLDQDWFDSQPLQKKALLGGLNGNTSLETDFMTTMYNGLMRDVKYRNNLWTAQEILDIYNAG